MKEAKVLQLIEEKKYYQLKQELEEMKAVDIADILDPLPSKTTLLIFRMLAKDIAVDVFANFSIDQQRDIINAITDVELDGILDELFFDDMIDMIEEMPANIVNKILKVSSPEERQLINQFLKYPEDSAGTIMTIEYVELRQSMTVKEALDHIKETGLNKETVYTCYVTDRNRVLEGIVSLRALVTEDENMKIVDLMERDIIFANTHDDQETVASIFKRYGFIAIPVVDKEHRLTGIITFDDIMDVMEQEATEDFQIMAAMAPSEEAYLESSIFNLAKQRLPWLLILMIGATLTAGIINRYEELLSTSVILMAFVPMLMDTGGNSGSQSSTLVIRGIAVGDIELHDGWKVIWKEFAISLLVGIALACVNFLKIVFIDQVGVGVALTVSITLVATVVMAKVIGGLLPIIAKSLKMDPAIMAGPLITTVVDSLALIIYFTIASVLLNLGV